MSNVVTIDSSTSLQIPQTSTLSVPSSADSSSSSQPTSLLVTESAPTSADAATVSVTSSVTFDVATSSTISPTSTSSPVLGNFNAIGQGGGASDTPARLPPAQYGSITLGGHNPSGVAAGVFSIDAGTGALFVDGSKICGFYGGSESASLYVCNASPRTNEAPITCDQGQADGGVLKCSAPKMNCIEDFNDENDPVCYATGGVWTQFMGFQLLGDYFLLSIGSMGASSQGNIAINLIIQAI
ncbi:uncharacterized protein FTOL_01434 [Fusarium torulosum]|uniref:Uncharacterized protein n=1 Tax=Fusarium torulosum TaxID=33205 RepID=A0AAE8LZY7_9HYPO|nr:uncharacterized protein FTOL_01434 [Fusarium torulosum]